MVRLPVSTSHKPRLLGVLLQIVLFLLVFVVIVPQFGSFRETLPVLGAADKQLLVMGLLVTIASFIAAANTYQLLFVRRAPYRQTLGVQVASGFVNRLLPAGIGGMGLNALYMRKHKHTMPQAVAAVALNNTLGFVGNILLIGGALVLQPQLVADIRIPLPSQNAQLLLLVLSALVVSLLIVRGKITQTVRSGVRSLSASLLAYRKRRLRLILALGSSILLTSCYVTVLWLSLMAVQGEQSWAVCLLVMSLGTFVGAAVPTPGGLGGVEAGLIAGFAVFGAPLATGLAVVLVYRALVFWLPLLPGAAVYYVSIRKLL